MEHFATEGHLSSTQILEEAAVEYEDDDYYDVESDEEMDVDSAHSVILRENSRQTFSMMLAIHQARTDELSVRRYDSVIYDGMLDSYRAEWVATPLKNPQTARVFAHFIYATGPSLSIYERHPRNSSVMFSEGPVPLSQQGLWTYTMPMAALHHQGLLHAMLALASLHIAKLQGASSTPSFKHYAYALKRVHSAVGHPKKRLLITTLAASLLLGFYEVMTADHIKWSSHLHGAKQLVAEIPWADMTADFKRMKAERAAYHRYQSELVSHHIMDPQYADDSHLDQLPEIDQRFLDELSGKRYDGSGRVLGETARERTSSFIPGTLDLSKFEILKDLYWWYCKQDVFQSIVSGNNLLLDYRRWADCPPRAPVGKSDAVYGSFDHLILLLGRIADFAAKDRGRKLKVMDSNGGMWEPPLGMQMGPPPGAAPSQGQHTSKPPTSSHTAYPRHTSGSQGAHVPSQSGPAAPMQPPPAVPFFGKAPSRPNNSMPASYASGQSQSPSTLQDDHLNDLNAATDAAMDEWTQIRHALNSFASRLGPAFQPLGPEFHQPLATPFGDAVVYRSYDIGCLWAVWHMAVIIAIRSHPSMPPAAMMAAGVAAQQTASMAHEVARIAAGIAPTPRHVPLSPSLGAALVESTMPCFFAGVQYRDAAQRAWIVARILDIEARTGWASAGLIARGCETAWVKAAAAGRGPPYERVRDVRHADERINGAWERESEEPPREPSDRRNIHRFAPTRVHWAIGIIGMEEDVARIDLNG